MKIKVTTDSTADLGSTLIERYSIGVLPLCVVLDERIYRDGEDITPQDIFDYVASENKLPKTSAPSVEDYSAFFKKQLESNDCVLHFNISSLASASHQNAKLAAAEFKGKVFAIDSLALSTGQGLLVIKACELASQGLAPKKIVAAIDELKTKVNTSFVPDALDYLHKGGRCSLAALMGAKVLKLHPMIDMKDGKLYAKKKYRGNIDRCIKTYINDLYDEYPDYDKSRCFITHSNCEPELVEIARKMVEEKFEFEEILETKAGCVITTHCGKNTLGVLFITK